MTSKNVLEVMRELITERNNLEPKCELALKDESLSIEERWEMVKYLDKAKSYIVGEEEAPLLRAYIDNRCDYDGRGTMIYYEGMIDMIQDEGWEYVGNEEDDITRLTVESEETIRAIKIEAIKCGYVGCCKDW